MSKKERLASSLDQLSDLCFTISELVISESSSEEVAKPSTSVLRPGAPVYTPTSVTPTSVKKHTPEEEGSKSSISDDWESVPDLPSESVDTPPSYSQVVGGS